MAAELELTARQVKSIMDTLSAAKGVDSLTSLVHEEEETTLEDLISDDGKGNPHDVFLKNENQKSIKRSMEDLSDRDRQVIIMRYGLADNEPKTLGEVADFLGLSRERVRQIEERAVNTLRKEAIKAGILEPVTLDMRTRKLHSAMRPRLKTNILGETEDKSFLAKLLKKNAKAKAQASAKTIRSPKRIKANPTAKKKTKKMPAKPIKNKKVSAKKPANRALKKAVKHAAKKATKKPQKKASQKGTKKTTKKLRS